jgi:hypothetical protein
MTCKPNSSLTAEQKNSICSVLSLGCDRETAANWVACSLADIRRAMRADAAFAANLRHAEAGAEMKHMRVIYNASEDVKNWRASVWWLERHSPERFGPRVAGQITRRQLKAFIELMSEIVLSSTSGSESRQLVLGRLKSLSDSLELLMRDAQASEALSISEADQLVDYRDTVDETSS